ncbi:FAD-binding protein [Microbacterium dauci]|uniref:FAD-binding protein n=1 Tax=Microbacterium dauci TaxID=3048008 RepID=A0ABT6ZD88_9MICO|nr:FAD-binding protein [Microbacterium sp. LX3-4]MDJ1114132.1 FAD-binding protein [Microbacterium sp. LX3-4]
MSDEVNWAGNVHYASTRIARPTTIDEARELVAGADAVKALGSRHSFTGIADTSGIHISLADLDVPIRIDAARQRVRVGGGVRYGELAQYLEQHGWALANLASLPHISVAGAISTGTHGSGVGVPSLAAAVTGLELLTSAGDLVVFSDGDPDLPGAVVGLGALGLVTTVELAIEPTFEVAQTVYEQIPFDAVTTGFDEIMGSAYSASLFTTLRDDAVVDQVWRKARTDAAQTPLPAALIDREAAGPRHPLPEVSAAACTVQGGTPGPWLDRLPHFRLEFTPSNGDELQSEFLVPHEHGPATLAAVRELAEQLRPVLQVCEVRRIAADGLWLSPSYDRDSVAFHFTWTSDGDGVARVLPDLEAALAPFSPRPHWGKVFTPRPVEAWAELYPQWRRFRELRNRLDARGAFRNDFLRGLGL